jgi:co-chaperonin GroES (HSP10)|tara:strand:- start:122 stop:379 length:258 start_codon:yes stop_codon:yes gene_type:complete
MKAVNKYIIIDRIKQPPIEKNGLILSDKHQDEIRYTKAKVRSVGTNVEGVSSDDLIYYDRHAGYGIEHEGEHLFVIKEQDVVVVL